MGKAHANQSAQLLVSGGHRTSGFARPSLIIGSDRSPEVARPAFPPHGLMRFDDGVKNGSSWRPPQTLPDGLSQHPYHRADNAPARGSLVYFVQCDKLSAPRGIANLFHVAKK
jgi:hypothetical protein